MDKDFVARQRVAGVFADYLRKEGCLDMADRLEELAMGGPMGRASPMALIIWQSIDSSLDVVKIAVSLQAIKLASMEYAGA